ncbi:Transcription factor IIIC [Macleaya cordata]|uniref:Transcription factor IIIC n=1 Tax=Macleaya cordata TaxID=56857 RepID=A0A200R2W2_MACCD|nr:Transcription factor IIIC [Macleaya cordata]
MGIIKDGTISGVLPEKEGFAVHYPGYPSSISRAVETLGGTEGILKARSSKSNSLELHFRPEDPYSHPAFGRLRPCCNLLLKISKKKTSDTRAAMVSENMSKSSKTKMTNLEPDTCYPKSVETSQQSGPGSTMSVGNEGNEAQMQEPAASANLFADIVARVPEAYHYDGMVDYQHVLAVHADASRKKKRHWADVEPKFEKGGLLNLDQEDLMILVPPLFSPKDVPENLVLRPLTALSSKKKQEAVVQQQICQYSIPYFFVCFSFSLLFCLKSQQIPRKINWEENIQQGSSQWEGLMAISKLFDERPIWPRCSLSERLLDENLKFGDHLLKRLLFKTAYYFSTGPFRRFYIRKGYDPRKDPESRIYQGIDFRLPPPLRNFGDANPTNELAHTWKDLCAFRVFPWKCQTALQLSELVDDYIQQEIKKPPERTTCSCSTGWFSSHVLDSLRLRVAVRFLSIYPKPGAKDLLKSANERFEKSKRVHALKRDLRLDEEENQHVNKDSSTHEPSLDTPMEVGETELGFDDDVDEPDDEENDGDGEIEEEEEELDEYESLHMDDNDGDFSLQSSYPIGENISKNYLQELFGSFPSSGVVNNKVQDGEISDGEYQIFEEDSDDNDNYSDDDN